VQVFADVRLSSRQLVLTLALPAAWFLLGSASAARAGYVSVDRLSRSHEGLFTCPSLAAGAWGSECEGGAAGSNKQRTEEQDQKKLDRDHPERLDRFVKLFHTAWHFGFDSGTGSSTGTSSVNGPTSQPAGGLSPFALILIEAVGLLPPQRGVAHPFSVASFLFRPPRAAV
jgi:hypothetical protein